MQLRNPGRRIASLTIASLAIAATWAPTLPAGAATADEVVVLGLSNRLRASVGSQPLALDETLSVTARRWAVTVAAAGRISHNPDLAVTTGGRTAIAENVVVGPSIQAAHDALVASRGHYDNLVNPTVSQVGIGVAWSGGMVYVVEDFLIVRGTTAPTSPPTTTAPAGPRSTTPQPATRPPAPPAPTASSAPLAPTVGPTSAPLPGQAGPASSTLAGAGPSAWMTLSFEVLQIWDRASG